MGRRFLRERRRDPFYRAAQAEGLRSRAAFKLGYLDDTFHLLRPGARVLDLGAAPGGWSVVARSRVGPRGSVTAVDPRPVAPAEGVRWVRGRVGDPALAGRLAGPFDVVLADLSPRISGAYATDHARSVDLVRAAFELARGLLVPGGSFVAKVFAGDLLDELAAAIGPSFDRLVRTKPPASRERSSELYLVARGFRPGGAAPPAAGGPAAPPDATPPPPRPPAGGPPPGRGVAPTRYIDRETTLGPAFLRFEQS